MDDRDERGASDMLGGLGLNQVLQELGVADEGASEAMHKLGLAQHSALQASTIYNDNFEDDDGTAPEPELTEEEKTRRAEEEAEAEKYYRLGASSLLPQHKSEEQILREKRDKEQHVLDELQRLLPAYKRDAVLNFTDLFTAPRPAKKRRLVPPKGMCACLSTLCDDALTSIVVVAHPPSLPLEQRQGLKPYEPGVAITPVSDLVQRYKSLSGLPAARVDRLREKVMDPSLSTDAWQNQTWTEAEGDFFRKAATLEDDFQWDDSIRWHAELKPEETTRFYFDLNDSQMVFEEVTPDAASAQLQHLSARAARSAANLNPLNLSNDRFYEIPREHRQKVRQTLGQLVVQHARPAAHLQLPFYKTRLIKHELHAFHRPAIQFPTNIPISFSKVQSSRKDRHKKAKSKDAFDVFNNSRDLSLKDTSSFVLYEYSEEHPPVLSNYGMGHILVNYFRKKSAKEETIPRADLGETFVLEPQDESPFMGFGQVEPGQMQPTLYNNMIRAPLFPHKPQPTDFLLIRNTTKDQVTYHLRNIQHVFVVGQQFPIVQIPGPHARLATNLIKTRLHMIAHKLLQRSKGHRIKMHRVMRYFPDYNELQMRMRLKEFMEYNRKAGDPDQGYWKLMPGIVVPDEASLYKQLPPEHMVLCESMQAGQQRLVDLGLLKLGDDANEDDESGEGNEVEQSVAPWLSSKNFLNGASGKAMLALHGEGDPSGRGEAFSFIRVSMKEIFIAAGEDPLEKRAAMEAEAMSKSGHRYNVAEQQQIYRSEINRIWNAQRRALSATKPPKVSRRDLIPMHRSVRAYEQEIVANQATKEEDTFTAPVTNKDRYEGKILRIRRLIDGEWRTEYVRDRSTMEDYLRQRQTMLDAQMETEQLAPTGDAVLDAARQKRIAHAIAHLKKCQDRRMQRKQAQAASAGQTMQINLHKAATKRTCGRCGQVGHMATNTSCPLFNKAPAAQSSAAAANADANMSLTNMPVGLGAANPFASSTTVNIRGPAGSPPASSPLASAASPPAPAAAASAPKLKFKMKKRPSTPAAT